MKRPIHTDKGAQPIGPYSQGIVTAGPQLYVSAQGPLDPATGRPIDGDFAAQAERAFANVQAIVEAAGATMADVVKVTVYLTDWANFGAMNEVYGRYFPQPYPARTPVQTTLPAGLIMVDAVVALREEES